jgi:serine/threonine-protein kinase
MAVAEVHPSVEELTAFTLGTLSDEAQASIEDHVATCTSCQERAATAPGDSFVELVRSVRVRTSQEADTIAEAAAQVQTPVLFADVAGTEALAPAVAPAAPAESGRPENGDAIPPELAGHARYRVVRLLGSGGMGAVYLAEHRVMRRCVAVKIIRRDYTANPNVLDRFRGEVENAARLSHPNIVTTYDAEDAGETHFLAMEYVEGTDLGRLVQEHGTLPVDRACDYVRQAALGLQYAFEQQGMVHRDLKPHNLMLTQPALYCPYLFRVCRILSLRLHDTGPESRLAALESPCLRRIGRSGRLQSVDQHRHIRAVRGAAAHERMGPGTNAGLRAGSAVGEPGKDSRHGPRKRTALPV